MEIRTSPSMLNNSVEISTTSSFFGAISWGAILAGALIAVALSLCLLFLGKGLGLSAVSPWATEGINGTTFVLSTILWVTLTSIVASSIGGYVAGRLRAGWRDTPLDEIHFRDTAQGLLAWALATLVSATLLASVLSAMVNGGIKMHSAMASETAALNATTLTQDKDPALNSYFLDYLFRQETDPATAGNAALANSAAPPQGENTTKPTADIATATPHDNDSPHSLAKAEVAQIFLHALAANSLTPTDVTYAGQLIAEATGKSQQNAEARVKTTFSTLQAKIRDAETAARETADNMRKASAYGSLWLFIALLMGAFGASWMAVLGGQQRDQ